MQCKRFQSDWQTTRRVVVGVERKIGFGDFLKSGLRRYAEKTNLHGLIHLADKQRCPLERTLWGLILLGAICFGSYMIYIAYSNFLDAPTSTTKLPNQIKVSEVEFPAIAICTGNRMSKKAVMEYAEFVWTNQRKVGKIVGQNTDEIYRILLLMISLYNFESYYENWDKLNRLHEFLAAFYGGQYPIEDIMDGFVPKCSDILLKCADKWGELDCGIVMEFRKTDSGRCCTFNYLRPTEETPKRLRKKRPAFRVKASGELNGFVVHLKTTAEDNAAVLHSTQALMVKIWNSHTFPDMMSGGLKQIMVNPGLKYLMSITPQINLGSERLRDLDPINRGCIFDDETLPQQSEYPPNDCVFLCRLQHLVDRCNCYPFHYINSYNRTHCMLADLQCLNHAQIDWLTAEPPSVSAQSVEKYLFQCPQCIPKCDSVRYMVQTSFFDFSPVIKDANKTLDQMGSRNLLHFFFSQDYVFGNEQTLTYTWYDLLSNFGGLVGLTIGGSLIGIAELVYFLTADFGSNWPSFKARTCKQLCLRRKPIRANQPGWRSPTLTEGQLYWNELNSVYYNHHKH